MATSVQEIIDQARDYNAAFGRQAVPDFPALKALERIQAQLFQLVVQENPDALSQWFIIEPLPDDLMTGLALPEHLSILGADAEYDPADNYGYRNVEITLVVPGQSLTTPVYCPTAYVMNGLLYLTDLRQWFGDLHGWEDVVRVRVRYVPAPMPLTSLTSPISLPDSAVVAMVTNLALWMADRTGTALPMLREAAAGASAGWLAYMTGPGSGNSRAWGVEVVE